MILADSMRQTASMALWVRVADMATHHTIFALDAQADRAVRNGKNARRLL
jgi:hypothetical protein